MAPFRPWHRTIDPACSCLLMLTQLGEIAGSDPPRCLNAPALLQHFGASCRCMTSKCRKGLDVPRCTARSWRATSPVCTTFLVAIHAAQRTLGSSTFGARIHAEVFAGSSTGALADLLSRFSCPTVPA